MLQLRFLIHDFLKLFSGTVVKPDKANAHLFHLIQLGKVIKCDSVDELRRLLGIDAQSIVNKVKEALG